VRRPVVALLLACLVGGLAPAPLPAAPQAYFSPDGGIFAALLGEIEAAGASIDVAIFDFTAGELAAALVRARARGVTVRVVADARQAAGRHSAIPGLVAAGIEVRLVRGKGRGIMHNKFAIFDGRLLVTGSYNWTSSAEAWNYENALFLDDRALIARYAVRFERLLAGSAVTPTGR